MKRCGKCLKNLEEAEFHVRRKSADGIASICKACVRAKNKAYKSANAARIRVYRARYYSEHRAAEMANAASFRGANKAVVKGWFKVWYEGNKDVSAVRNKKWRNENRDRLKEYRESNADRIKAYARKWRDDNILKCREYLSRRRAALLGSTPQWADQKKIEEFYFAADLLSMVTGIWHHVDHIVPLRSELVCGLHCEQNLQILSATENLRKGNRYWPYMPTQAVDILECCHDIG
ncbi:hypothetical protein [Paraburkholderia fungorum]